MLENPATEPQKNYNTDTRLLTDTYDAVLDDAFLFGIFWGEARKSKTTLVGHVLHNLFNNDWNKTLMAIRFNLDQTLTNIEKGIPERVWTKNGFHNRVPGVCWDDFSATGNKARSQYDTGFDEFKAGFDVFGTSVANIFLTMLDPASITNQLMWKYNFEVQLIEKGHYKYDRCQWRQCFNGWRPIVKKIPIENNTFDPWPRWVYLEYDQLRMSLVPEVFQRIRDAQKLSKIDELIQLCDADVLTALRKIQLTGPMRSPDLITYLKEQNIQGKYTVNRCKSRSLLNPQRYGDNYYKLELGFLGNELLKALDKDQDLEKEVQSRRAPKVDRFNDDA